MAIVNKYISDQMVSMSRNDPITRGKLALEFEIRAQKLKPIQSNSTTCSIKSNPNVISSIRKHTQTFTANLIESLSKSFWLAHHIHSIPVTMMPFFGQQLHVFFSSSRKLQYSTYLWYFFFVCTFVEVELWWHLINSNDYGWIMEFWTKKKTKLRAPKKRETTIKVQRQKRTPDSMEMEYNGIESERVEKV